MPPATKNNGKYTKQNVYPVQFLFPRTCLRGNQSWLHDNAENKPLLRKLKVQVSRELLK
jgi:hypothetical protein